MSMPPPTGPLSRPPGQDFIANTAPAGRKGRVKSPKRQGTSEARPSKRIASTNRLLMLAAALAVIAFGAFYFYNSSRGTYEAIFSQQMPAGATIPGTPTTGTSTVVTAIKLPPSALTPGAYTDSTQAGAIAKALAAIPPNAMTIGVVPSGTVVLPTQFSISIVTPTQLGSDELVSVSASINNAVGGSLQVGNYVDIYATGRNSNQGSGQPTDVLVAAQIKIVAIHAGSSQYENVATQQATNPSLNPSDVLPVHPVPGIYILQVTHAVAAQIAAAQTGSGTLYLSYVAPPAS
jgi:Flp pilus assembly protein CpaB